MFFKRFQELMPGRPLILGHRGAPHSAPENSLESFRIALAAGADGIELDVQITGDGVLVAHHDGSLPSGEKLS
ncbi:glycerophosphodiester phosphodiesterase [bacterium]|nr:glycerophosphodiester phosphodiesterase [bacterium]